MRARYEQHRKLVHTLRPEESKSVDELIEVIRTDLRDDTALAAELVNRWFDTNLGYYAESTLSSVLGTHQEQFELYCARTWELTVIRRLVMTRRSTGRTADHGWGAVRSTGSATGCRTIHEPLQS